MKRLFLIGTLFLLLPLPLTACDVERGLPDGVVLETTHQVATFTDKSLEEVLISALIKNIGDGGVLTIHALVEPVNFEPMEDSREEYFEKDAERKVFFTFRLESNVEFTYHVWTTK